MNLTPFLETYPSVLFSPDGDHRFEALRLLTRGHSSAKQAKLLHHASTFLDDKECYLEIGTYTGYTLCAAGLESLRRFVGIDNFTENYANADIGPELKSNMERYLKNFLFKRGDFRTVSLDELDKDQMKIGVFYVDARHTHDDVIDAVNWGLPRFSKDTLVMFDDLNVEGVRVALAKTLEDKRFDEIFRSRSFFDNTKSEGMASDPYIHNGFSLVVYRGNNELQ